MKVNILVALRIQPTSVTRAIFSQAFMCFRPTFASSHMAFMSTPSNSLPQWYTSRILSCSSSRSSTTGMTTLS